MYVYVYTILFVWERIQRCQAKSKIIRGRPHGQCSIMESRERTFSAGQISSLKRRAIYALTIFRAGVAFTLFVLPRTVLFPAFVGGFVRILIEKRPGTVKTHLFFNSAVATQVSVSRNLEHTDFFTSLCLAISFAKYPLGNELGFAKLTKHFRMISL